MLPTLALVRSEKVVDYVVGFDQLGGRDDFTTDALRARLQAAGLLAEGGAGPGGRPGGGGAGAGAGRSMRQGGGGRDAGDEDSDFD